MKENNFLLVSVKSKKTPAQSQVYVVLKEDISSFVKEVLDEDTVLLIDSVETFASESYSINTMS